MRYGYIGLGNLGEHLAMSLLRAGFQVTVNDLNKTSAKRLLEAGAKWADTPRAVAEEVKTIRPPPWSTISGHAALAMWNEASRWVLTTRSR